MNTPASETFKRSSQVLLGFEKLNPEQPIIPKVRYALESLTFSGTDKGKVLTDFFAIVEQLGDYPATPHLKRVAMATSTKSVFEGVLGLFSYFVYNNTYEEIRQVVKHFNLSAESEELKNQVLSFVDSKGAEENLQIIQPLSSMFYEQDPFTKVKKLLDVYFYLYDEDHFLLLKKAYEHYVSLNSELQFYAFIHRFCDLPLLDAIKHMMYEGKVERFDQALSKGQVSSKLWALESLNKMDLNLKSALVLCGWFGVLPYILLENGFEQVVSLDKDPSCEPLAERFNQQSFDQGRFLSVTQDIFDLDYQNLNFSFLGRPEPMSAVDLLINTSCEHIANFSEWYDKIPPGQLMLLQSNDFFSCEEHVNCVNSTSEFREQTPMQKRLFSGALPLDKYTRYMVIGYK
jgi:hypothetical protein